MSAATDLTKYRWGALGAQAVALGLMAAPTLPYHTMYQDADSKEILTQLNHITWFSPYVPFGGANFAAWGAIAAVIVAGVLTFMAARQARGGNVRIWRSPMVVSALGAALAAIALMWGGGQSVWGWVAVVLLAAATALNFLPTRPAGRPLLPPQ
ncbi:MAG: hypothetical protein Q4G35_11980 [Propionibacteriaceae bacterium]|nr:hypothetical protein [Propionibacteriaceae bacterium]